MSETKPKKTSIAMLREQLAHVQQADDPLLAALAADSRKGVASLLLQTNRRLTAQANAEAAFEQRLQLERACWAKGQSLVAALMKSVVAPWLVRW